jgi:transmembrane sensor
MSRLQLPLKDLLEEPADESTLRRMWTRIDDRAPAVRRSRRRAALAVVALAAAATAVVAVVVRRDSGPLRLEDGRSLVAVDAPAAGGVLSLSDHSRIELEAGARFEPLESTGTTFVASLQRGSAAFDVRPGGPRRWQVECGLATVEVIGTRFACERGPARLRVSVQRGAVLVRGERIAGRARRLVAGESLDVFEAPPVVPTPAPVPVSPPATDEGGTSVEPMPPARAASWRELARGGRNGEAFAVLGTRGIHRETHRLGATDLLALADVARLSGHPAEAVEPLDRILARFADDPQASLAAFTLGRVELDSLDRPRRAVVAFDRALALGVPRSLDEDVRVRLVEAHLRAGDRAAARDVARRYLRDYPTGHHHAEMETQAASN